MWFGKVSFVFGFKEFWDMLCALLVVYLSWVHESGDTSILCCCINCLGTLLLIYGWIFCLSGVVKRFMKIMEKFLVFPIDVVQCR